MAAWRAGVSLMVLVRGRTCDCSPKGTQHLRTIKTLQADIVKKAIGHVVSVGLNTRHRRLSQRSTRLPKRFMIGAEGLEPSRARCRAGPWPSCKWRDDGIVPLICPTCQNVFAGIAQSIDASDRHATLHGVVFDILVGSESRVGPCGCLSVDGRSMACQAVARGPRSPPSPDGLRRGSPAGLEPSKS